MRRRSNKKKKNKGEPRTTQHNTTRHKELITLFTHVVLPLQYLVNLQYWKNGYHEYQARTTLSSGTSGWHLWLAPPVGGVPSLE